MAIAVAIVVVVRGVYVVIVQYFGIPGKLSVPTYALALENDVHHDFPCVHRKIGIVERPIKLFFGHRLIGRVVIWCEIRVSESVSGFDTLPGVEDQHTLE